MDKNPNYVDNTKVTNEDYFMIKVKNEQLVEENDNLIDKNYQLSMDIEQIKENNTQLLSENENFQNPNKIKRKNNDSKF